MIDYSHPLGVYVVATPSRLHVTETGASSSSGPVVDLSVALLTLLYKKRRYLMLSLHCSSIGVFISLCCLIRIFVFYC